MADIKKNANRVRGKLKVSDTVKLKGRRFNPFSMFRVSNKASSRKNKEKPQLPI